MSSNGSFPAGRRTLVRLGVLAAVCLGPVLASVPAAAASPAGSPPAVTTGAQGLAPAGGSVGTLWLCPPPHTVHDDDC